MAENSSEIIKKFSLFAFFTLDFIFLYNKLLITIFVNNLDLNLNKKKRL